MYRTACGVATGLHQRQRLLVHTLAGKSGIAVHQHRQHLLALRVTTAIHARAHGAFHHRIDDFQVRGVERQAQVHRAASGRYVGAEALVVFHVTGGQVFGGGVLEFGKQILGHLAQGIDQHVQAATVGHANHHFLHPFGACGIDQLVHCHDEALAAFQREPFLANILGVQIAL